MSNIKEKFIENTINLSLGALKAREIFEGSRRVANDNPLRKIQNIISVVIGEIKYYIDNNILGKYQEKVHDFLSDLFLGSYK
ncbi:hypothetical protein LCGC14_0224030 [marine sediment metagenome]|uniref:Uncharacterized protein n=1 Tax=marine sediment metagenome TaxID=412755 RepID=A0A0F9UCC4_9ZZZZ